jgi:hypothetical protein
MKRTNLFFPLPQRLALQHFLAGASLRARRVSCCAPLQSSGALRRQPLHPFNLHRARVRRNLPVIPFGESALPIKH